MDWRILASVADLYLFYLVGALSLSHGIADEEGKIKIAPTPSPNTLIILEGEA